MKKLILSLIGVVFALATTAQVVVRGVTPETIANNYEFAWADPAGGDWSCPDFLVPNTFVEAPIMLADDGTEGENPQGNPMSAEACNGPLINDMTGKIAIIYRNTCEFGYKALQAQDAGAVGVIILNRDPEVVGMGGGVEGLNVTIPTVMLSSIDGATLTNEMANGEVVVFMGNKQNLFANDGGSSESSALSPRYGSVPVAMANNNYSFQVGIEVYNFGSADNTFNVTASVDGPAGNVYTETVSALIVAGDTLPIFNGNPSEFSTVAPGTWDEGDYSLTYTIAIDGQTDESDFDNVYVRNFSVTSMLSLAGQENGSLKVNSFPSNATASYQTCMMLQDVYPSVTSGVSGVYFAAQASDSLLQDEEIIIDIFEWNDAWIDVSAGFAAVTFDDLNQVGGGLYYPASNDENGQVVYAALDNGVTLADNQRYLACLTTYNPNISFGYDNSLNYDANYSIYLQPISPLNIDGTQWYSGWNGVTALALGLKIEENAGLEEIAEVSGSAFPNPAIDVVTIDIDGEGSANVVVSDISGRIAFTNNVILVNGQSSFDISSLDKGVYMFNVTLENGSTSTFSVVKK
tara:strand:- start:628 stop:2355 length:1728 start_codon:yes stop_codon:yes gene_type:complete